MAVSTSSKLARHKVVFYFDVVSPWARVALTTIRRYVQPWNLELDLQPINLGYVMKYAENRPPVSVANKGLWMFKDMERASQLYGVALNKPAGFPVNTFNAQLVLRLVKAEHPAQLDKAIDALYDAVWTNDEDVTKVEGIEAILAKANVFSESDKETWQGLMQRATTKENRTALNQQGQALVEQGGAFGAPWIVVTRKSDGETTEFFGSDRTEMIAAFLHEQYRGPRADGSQPKL